MSKKIYVGNLSFRTTEEELTSLFEQIGAVESVSIITDRDTGRSKGFGFISIPGQDKDLFFHSNSLVGITFNELQEGDKVTFDVEESPKGKNAVNVQRVA